MRRFLLSACLAAATCANAQTLTFIETPDESDAVEVTAISNNGKYIGGNTMSGSLFLSDWQNNKNVMAEPNEELGGEIRNVSNNGTGIGYNGPGCTFNIDGKMTVIEEPTDNQYVVGKGITDDDKIMVGSVVNNEWYTDACYWENGNRIMLPSTNAKEMGWISSDSEETGTINSSTVTISSDGSVILGYLQDDLSTYPAILWKRTGDTYQLDTICKNMFGAPIWDDELYGFLPREEPYTMFTAINLSSNGKYAVLMLARNETYYDEEMDESFEMESESRIGIYNVETGELKEIVVDGSTGIEEGTGITPTAIADDGTVVGFAGNGFWTPAVGVILKAGESQPKLLADEFSSIEQLAEMDMTYNKPLAISADGRYIGGTGSVITEFEEDGEVYEIPTYKGYFIDVKGDPAAISSVSTTAKKTAEYFTADGRKVSAPVKGINIIKTANGETKKVFIK